jgi:DNA-binding helix-hairpin-helix protein with protein kinase domain
MRATQSRPEVVDSQGRPIPLGAVLGKGGEGTVYEVRQSPVTAAKVYHKPLSADRSEKIRAMVRMRTEPLAKLTSWPVDLLAIRGTGEPIGLLMPIIANRKNVHHLYGPKSRLQDFPRADWRFLVRAAANTAKAFAIVHDANCVIGDVNHGSIMVAQDATVALIDCDSFQVNTPGRRFLCEVGIETFTPPELQGLPFKGAVRTPNSDNFGLAVMIFHLLFMGRHPFAGRPRGAGDVPIAQAIKEFSISIQRESCGHADGSAARHARIVSRRDCGRATFRDGVFANGGHRRSSYRARLGRSIAKAGGRNEAVRQQ